MRDRVLAAIAKSENVLRGERRRDLVRTLDLRLTDDSALDSALRGLVASGAVTKTVLKCYETKSLASSKFGGVVTMRRKIAHYKVVSK